MPNITLSITEQLKKRIETYSSIKWSNVVRSVIEQKLDAFEEAERIASKSKLTLKDFEPISKKIEAATVKEARALLNEIDR